ncbi:dihydrofolate reductase [Catenulispora sp. GP43]|uniref:dihydrofolate reductase family protein n=1 Tax=Catenulispora sp. GP43 TaxID=3156263 RepID=UPI0035181A76
MSTVVLDVSMSLDGFTAGADISEHAPLGVGGEQLHAWIFDDAPERKVDHDVIAASNAAVGAAVVGRRTFDLGLHFWGGTPWPGTPTFVVTHEQRADLVGDNGGAFAFDGVQGAVRRAKEAAGTKDVMVLGAHTAGSLVAAGLLDEVRIHLVPVLLGAGTPLFAGQIAALVRVGEPFAGTVTHLRYRVLKP